LFSFLIFILFLAFCRRSSCLLYAFLYFSELPKAALRVF